MARVNNLSNFLTDVASAIKTKKGSETAIPAANFDTEILALPSHGVYQTKVITINENGQTVITPDSGYDAMDGVQVTTLVPEKQLQTKSYNFTTNQTIELSPDTGYDGFDSVVLTINVPSGGVLQTKSVTYDRNNTYVVQPDSGYDGMSTVNVTVASPYNAKMFRTKALMDADPDKQIGDYAMVYGLTTSAVEPNQGFMKMYLPPTITLPEELTTSFSVDLWIMSSGGGGGGGSPTISPTGFTFWMGNMNSAYVEYSSEDGIHYTRDTVQAETHAPSVGEYFEWDEPNGILSLISQYGEHIEYHLSDNTKLDICKTIFQEPSQSYDGLYRVEQVDNHDKIRAVTGLVLNTHSSETVSDWTTDCTDYYMQFNTVKAIYQMLRTKMNISANGAIECLPNNKYRYYYYSYKRTNGSSTYNNTSAVEFLVLKKYNSSDDNIYFGFREYSTSGWTYSNYVLHVYEIDMTNETVTDVTSQYTRVGRVTTSSGSNVAFTYYTGMDFTNHYITYGRSYNDSDTQFLTYVYNNSSSYMDIYSGLNIPITYGRDIIYVPAETQFTLDNDNQLLPGYIALGIDGEHVGDGSIYQNLDINQIVQTTLNRPLVHTGDYITAANEQAVKYFEYDTTGTDVSMETNAIEFYENINNSGYTPFMANYYGFQYLSLDKTKYFYVNTDKNLVKVDLITNTSTVINLCTLADTSNTSVSLLIPKELLLYVKTDGHVYIYDVATDTEHDTTITINTSAYKGFLGKYIDDDYIFLAPSTTYATMDKTIYAISVSTFLPTVTKTGMGDVSYIWKSLMSNNYYFSIYTKSGSTYANQLWKFDGSAFTRLRSGGYTMGLQAGRVVLEDNTYIYAPYRQQQNFLKWSKTGSDTATSINVTNNTSVTLQFDTMFPDGDYIWTLGHVNSYDYYWVKCTCSLVSQVPTFTEVEKVRIPYRVYLYDNNTLQISQSITGASHTTKTADGFQYLEARYSTYNNDSNRVVGNCLLKRVTESTYTDADIDGVCEHATQNSALYPVYHLM
ncbi:MAG: hypothetical protein II393_02445 [Cytophagales bacterium]|nr:hypothetical protein [Cytophagales bacterium]